MQGKKSGRCREAGLSEVIGFILIIGLIVVIASLYLTYGVPAQGRENEILHMNLVKDQFVTYKISLDSLFNNDKVGTAVSNSFTLGTSGGYTQGSFTFIPLMSPVNSGGIIAINQRTEEPEMLTITSQSLILNKSVQDVTELPAGVPTLIESRPQHLYVNINGIENVDCAYGVTVGGTGWNATVNVTPQYAVFPVTTSQPSSACPTGTYLTGSTGSGGGTLYYCMNPEGVFSYDGTIISITVIKDNKPTLQNLPVFRNITSGRSYSVDIMDQAYGLDSVMVFPDTITLANTFSGKNSGTISGSGNATFGYNEMTFASGAIPLGSIEYRAQNNYWIPQTYYYQMGGIFLKQNDGNITYKLPPEITFSYDEKEKIVNVNVNALAIDQDNSGVVGGNSPVQIKTTLKNITDFPYARGNANTKWIKIGVQTEDPQARAMWHNYFTYEALAKGIPNYEVASDGTESYIRINGYDTSESGLYDINVIASNATFSAAMFGVGG